MNIPLTSTDYLTFTTVEPDQRIPYGDAPSQFVDLFLPDQMVAIMPAPKVPVVVLIHGGCWRAQYGLEPMGQFARGLNEEGIAVVNIEYRRLGNGGGWPTTFEDVAAAADSIRNLADEHNWDRERVVTVGHSAGGHLALWLGSRHQLKPGATLYATDPLPIKGVVSLAGIPDLAEAVKQEICGSAPSELMGGMPSEVGAHYMEGSPSAFLPLGIPHTHINGVDDQIVPVAYVRHFVEAAQASGDQAKLIAVEDAGHFEIVAAHLPQWAVVKAAIIEALD